MHPTGHHGVGHWSAAVVVALVACHVATISAHTAIGPDELTYGFVYFEGSPVRYEYFRATFGGPVSCGTYPLALAAKDNASDPFPLGCQPLSPEAAAAVKGHLLVVWRGNCSFVDKATHAQAAGVAGLIVVNNMFGLVRMPHGNLSAAGVHIPVVMVRNQTAPLLFHNLLELPKLGVQQSQLRASLVPSVGECAAPVIANVAAELAGDSAAVVEPAHAVPSSDSIVDGVNTGFVRIRSITGDDSTHSNGSFDSNVEFTAGTFGGVFIRDATFRVSFANPRNACEPLSAADAVRVSGTVLVVERGECALVNKTRIAQAAGAVGVLIVNFPADPPSVTVLQSIQAAATIRGQTVPPAFDDLQIFGPHVGSVAAMSDTNDMDVYIPVAMVSHAAAGWLWQAVDALPAHASVTLQWRPTHERTSKLWENLRTIRDAGASFWPADVELRSRVIVDLLSTHHPNSNTVRRSLWVLLSVLSWWVGFR